MFDSMTFEWDEVKARANLGKHSVGFPIARRAFLGTNRLEFDSDGEYDERRWVLIGLVVDQVLAVVYTMRGETYRIISARKAGRSERERYWNRENKLDVNNLPPISEEEEGQLEKLRSMRDEDIDLSDIPPIPPGTKWTRPGRLVGAKSPEVVAIDTDLLDHFGTGGRADAVKVNSALREYMKAHEKAS